MAGMPDADAHPQEVPTAQGPSQRLQSVVAVVAAAKFHSDRCEINIEFIDNNEVANGEAAKHIQKDEGYSFQCNFFRKAK